MLIFFFWRNPAVLAVVWVICALIYCGIMRKMGIGIKYALVPVVAEWKLSQFFFSSMRSFYQAALASCLFLAAGRYVGSESTFGIVFPLTGIVLYHIFLLRLNWKICKAFNRSILFRILMVLFPVPMMLILGYGRSAFVAAPSFKVVHMPKPVRFLLGAAVVVVTLAEFGLLIAVLGFFSIRENPPRIVREYIVNETIPKVVGITDRGEVVRREDVMEPEAIEEAQKMRSRDYFYPDHSGDRSVVVMEYIVATDLETNYGMASVNLAQIMDATKQGSDMTFVMQAGGAEYMFTRGMKDRSYARYTARDGKLEKVMDLPSTTCMTEGETLTDFIRWAKENYPADRYMLVLWDHGGGLAGGYGYDMLNDRQDGNMLMICSDFVEAVKEAGVKFDMIGFDTCLMQDIDFAYKLEPYTDYYLASEESESGFGWNYTLAFSELAKNPGISTEEFGTCMISNFDPYNTRLHDGEEDTGSTLSLLDLTYVKDAHEKLDSLFAREKEAILSDPENFANISIAASGAYTFEGKTQVDLLDYLERLDGLDYEDKIVTEEEMKEVTDAVKACVVVRNANSASGINGVSFCFPVKTIGSYDNAHTQMDDLDLKAEMSMCDDFFSIIAYQQASSQEDTLLSLFEEKEDFTTHDWYVKGFEDYDTADVFVDIPLKDTGAGYRVELPERAWKSVVDIQTIVYMMTDQGRMYLGSDHIGALDEEGNPLIAMDNTWPHVEGTLISYNADMARETEDGTVFSGMTRALLNGKYEIRIFMETDPVKEDSGEASSAHIIGYELENNPLAFFQKGMLTFEAGDTLEFLFDYYDNEGKYVKTEPYGKKVTVLNDKPLTVQDLPLPSCDIQFGGMLTDVYQRVFTTEML
ncbi:MAG: clostripain-related cysteine peptidase, partial [Eubacteriales bacterium]|nr:clostripain-related cysteine peptidase [Eubacteriales bacterium]